MKTALPKDLRGFLWHFLKNYKGSVYLYICMAILTGLWTPINATLVKIMIDTLNSPNISAQQIFWPALLFIINFETQNIFWRVKAFLNYKYQSTIKNNIIRESFNYVHGHTHQYFQDNLSGRIANQINILADNAEHILHSISHHLIRCLVLLILSLISMYLVNPIFCYALLAWLVIFAYFSLKMSHNIVALSEDHAEAESVLSGEMVDSIANASSVRIYAKQQYELTFLEKSLHATQKTFQNNAWYSLKLHFFQSLSLTVMNSIMLYFLINLYMQNVISIGDFALILGLSVEVGFMMWWASDQVDELNKAIGKCKQCLSKIYVPQEITDDKNLKDLIVNEGKISFNNVRFHYKNTDPLFENINITIHPHEKIGLVGYSGSGKTSFVNLILRLYDIDGGHIDIDDQSISNVTLNSLRKSIAMIPQDPSLFHRNIMDNIRYGNLDASDEEVINASVKAHCHEFICQMPEGYHTLVGERGVKLSGGQRQRLAIARAVLKNAPILILDEATSQLDSITENYIQDSLHNLMQNKTTIVIAHRLSTLLNMDRIIVFDKGRIIDDGSHESLLKKQGLYKTLWDAQVGGFLPE